MIDRLQFVDEMDRTRSELGGEFLTGPLGPDFVSLPRGDLARAIFDLIEGKVEIIFGDGISALRERAQGVEVSFARMPPRQFDLVDQRDAPARPVRHVDLAHGNEERLRAFIESKQRSAAQFASSFAPRTRFGLFIRDQVLKMAARFRPVAHWLMERFVADRYALPDYGEGGGGGPGGSEKR